MAIQLQLRKGTKVQNDAFTGAEGELTYDSTTKAVRVHDGTTQGGIEIPTAGTADYVVEFQTPTAENNYMWYRKYKSGWVEQGVFYGGGANRPTITLPVPITYTWHTQATIIWNSADNVAGTVRVVTCDGTDITFQQSNGTSAAAFNFSWEVKGMVAE